MVSSSADPPVITRAVKSQPWCRSSGKWRHCAYILCGRFTYVSISGLAKGEMVIIFVQIRLIIASLCVIRDGICMLSLSLALPCLLMHESHMCSCVSPHEPHHLIILFVLLHVKSTDGGATWTPEQNLTDGSHPYMTGAHDRLRLLSNGRLVQPVHFKLPGSTGLGTFVC